jgi:hypothetical protein
MPPLLELLDRAAGHVPRTGKRDRQPRSLRNIGVLPVGMNRSSVALSGKPKLYRTTLCQNSLDTYVHFSVRRSYRTGISLTGVFVRWSYCHSKQLVATGTDSSLWTPSISGTDLARRNDHFLAMGDKTGF